MPTEPSFTQGIVWACARLVELFDQPTMAREILRESGAGHEELKQCSEYDLAMLRTGNKRARKAQDKLERNYAVQQLKEIRECDKCDLCEDHHA